MAPGPSRWPTKSSPPASTQPNLLKFHRPRTKTKARPDLRHVPALKQESKQCLRNLVAYQTPRHKMVFPRSRCAAVLVALFVGRMGDLYVLLSRRSATLRSYAGDTSLPGGKVDDQDRTIEDTARREAFEEIGLPRDRTKVPLLCILEPFLAGNMLIVTPVVVLILDQTLTPILNAAEVTSLFSHPLSSFLSSSPPFPGEPESEEMEYHTYRDVDWASWVVGGGWKGRRFPGKGGKIRMHRFLTGREAGGIKPVYGLTAAILIRTATIGYACEPSFEVNAPDAPSMDARIASAMLYHPTFREVLEMERVVVDEGLMKELESEGRVGVGGGGEEKERGKGKGRRRREGQGERIRRFGMLRDLSRL